MTFDWQTTTAICLVFGAGVYVVRYIWRAGTSKSQAGCGACRQCAHEDAQQQLVSIEPLDKPHPR